MLGLAEVESACARDEWEHLVPVATDYAPARVNLAILRLTSATAGFNFYGATGSRFAR